MLLVNFPSFFSNLYIVGNLCFGGLYEKLYFFAMKSLMALFLLIGLFACRDKPLQSGPRPRLVPKDSMPIDLGNPYASIDVSPMDMSYLPVDYPKLISKKKNPVPRVIYSRPHKQGRKIFGQLLKYGEPWRLGANEATELEVFEPLRIKGKTVPPGKYILYCIPFKDKWTIVFNRNLYSWGLEQDSTKDFSRFDASISILKNQSIEYFTMVFQDTKNGADLVMVWDDVEGRLPIEFIQ
jgi:hypothetical protein